MMQLPSSKKHPPLQSLGRRILTLGWLVTLGVLASTRGVLPHQSTGIPTASPLKSHHDLLPGADITDSRKIALGGMQFRPRSDNPYPEETESSGVRNDALCSQDSQSSTPDKAQLSAVAPEGALKLTASARPTVWIALPQTRAKQVIFSLEKIHAGETVSKEFHSQNTYPITQSPALMGLDMPADAPDLELDTFYQWSVLLVCGDTPHPSDPYIFASMQRVELSSAQPSQNRLKEYSIALSQDGFWYDPMSILLEAFQTNPNDSELPQFWQSLLKSANLGTIAETYGPNKSPILFP